MASYNIPSMSPMTLVGKPMFGSKIPVMFDIAGEMADGERKIKEALGYTTPIMEKCCAKCAFSSIDGNDGWGCKECAYMSAARPGSVNTEVNDYGVCNHFLSREAAKMLKDCGSPEELDLKLSIFGIQLDDLLVTELKDSCGCCEKATKKMMDYASTIACMLGARDDIPLAVNIKNITEDGRVKQESISWSHNFSRINAFIKNHVDEYKKKMRVDKWKDIVSVFGGYN